MTYFLFTSVILSLQNSATDFSHFNTLNTYVPMMFQLIQLINPVVLEKKLILLFLLFLVIESISDIGLDPVLLF